MATSFLFFVFFFLVKFGDIISVCIYIQGTNAKSKQRPNFLQPMLCGTKITTITIKINHTNNKRRIITIKIKNDNKTMFFMMMITIFINNVNWLFMVELKSEDIQNCVLRVY